MPKDTSAPSSGLHRRTHVGVWSRRGRARLYGQGVTTPQPKPKLADDDPLMIRRRRFARFADQGKRWGYLLFLAAMVAFFIGLFTDFTDFWGWLMIGCLLAGSALLLPAIIIGYAVKAAERDDLGLDSGH